LLGGGGNFGVATEFVLRLHPQRKAVFSGYAVFPGAMVEKVFKVADEWFKSNKSPKACSLISMANPPPDREVSCCPSFVVVIF
jgi:FAD/FMN-containing dehydrogenase